MRAAAAALLAAAAAGGSSTASEFFVDPITVKVMSNRRDPFPSSAKAVDLAAQRGECERAQVWGWDDAQALTNVRVAFTDLATADKSSTLPASAWGYLQQGYVNASSPKAYTCIQDILVNSTRPPPCPPTNRTMPEWCDSTPPTQCRTGCPPNETGICGDGRARPGSCNLCQCNHDGTKCADDSHGNCGHACLSGWCAPTPSTIP